MKIILTIGISGSGKSTWATDFIRKNPDYVRVNRDAIRQQITGSTLLLLSKPLEDLVTQIENNQIRTILDNGYNVIVDATHLRQKYIDRFVVNFTHVADIELKVFPANLHQAIERIKRRDKLWEADLEYIKKQYSNYSNLNLTTLNYPKREVIKYKDSPGLNDCVICDLDGTLSLYDPKTRSSFDRDFENDEVNYAIANHLDSYPNQIVFFSGRNSKFRKQTEDFLNNKAFIKDYILVMRNEKDMRRDSVVKLEMFDNYIRGKYNVEAVFDDRLQVIEECWNPLGVFVFNCNQGNKRF